MAVFISASAALAAGVAMQRTVSDMARRERLPLEMRAGVSTGDAVRANHDWFGSPVVRSAPISRSV